MRRLSGMIWWTLGANTRFLMRERQREMGRTCRRGHSQAESGAGARLATTQNAWSHQELEEARKDPPLQTQAQPCKHLDFRPLALGRERSSFCRGKAFSSR